MTPEQAKQLIPIIQAYAEGKSIQIRRDSTWMTVFNPNFQEPWWEYRIKPEQPWYRVALMKDGSTESAGSNKSDTSEKDVERFSRFDKWLTPRITYEV